MPDYERLYEGALRAHDDSREYASELLIELTRYKSALIEITKHVDEEGWSNEAATIARTALKGNST